MTPKQKAIEIVHRYDVMQSYINGFSFEDAKDCALIMVDEILKDIEIIFSEKTYIKSVNFWQEVKAEILKTK